MTTQQPEALQLAFECEESAFHWVNEIDTRAKAAKLLRAQHEQIVELKAALVKESARTASEKRRADQMSLQHDMQSALNREAREELAKLAAAPQAVQAAVPEAIEQMAVDRYKVVPSHESMFHRWAVVAGNGTQQLYIGREGECQNMARKFMGAFLDGAFVAQAKQDK